MTDASGETTELTPKGKVLAVLGVNMTILMATLDMSIVNVSLPTLADALNTDYATVQWVILSYILVITCLLLLASRLGDMFGKKKLFMFGLVDFVLSSLLCGLSPNVWWLIGFRALQGTGAVLTQGLGAAIIADVVDKREMGKAMGFVGATVSVGLALGPSLGGILIGYFGWPFIFFINLPIGLLALFIIKRFVPALPGVEKNPRFDPLGALLLFLCLGSYSLGMTFGQNTGFSNLPVLLMLGGSLCCLAAFVFTETKVAQPMLDLTLFRNVLFSLSLIMGSLVFIGMAGNFIIPFFLQTAQGRTVQEVGLLMMVIPLSMGITAPIAGNLADKFGVRWLSIIGLLITVSGCYAVSTVHMDTPWWGFLLRAMPLGLGIGAFQAPNNSAIMGSAPAHRRGVASGLMNLSRTFGTVTGIPLIAALFAMQLPITANLSSRTDFIAAPPQALTQAVSGTYRIQALILLLVTFIAAGALILDRRMKRKEAVEEM